MHPDPEKATTILIAHLAGNSVGLSVGDGESPEAPSPAFPYLVVTPLGPFFIEGALSDVNALHSPEWQVTSVGVTRQQAEAGLAVARDRILTDEDDLDFTSMNYRKAGAVFITPAGPALESDRDRQPPLFLSSEAYRFTIVPDT